ncbi:MAG: energy-coupling factor transporter transmembrane protein EcfT [Tissierellia bacterium]|nr:energy-coupling factor transporter transmembrane protein EcfT [Tissierellia bacterium]
MTKELKLDPRTKLIIVLCFSTLGVGTNQILVLFFISVLALIVAKLFKVDLKRSLGKIKSLLKVLILIALVQSIFSPGQPLISVGNFNLLTIKGLEKGLQFILRMFIVIVSVTIMGTSTYREIIQGLVQWKLPYDIAFMVALGIRFLPMIREEIQDSLTAIQLRGIDIKNIPLKERINIYSYLFTPILVETLIKAERLAAAIEMRGFRAYDSRTSYLQLKLKSIDYLIIFLSLGLIILIFIKIYT